MNRELLKLKKAITKMTTPTREKEVCRALQTIFHDKDTGLTDKEAFQILNWDYNTKEELFGEHNMDNVTVSAYEECASFILNTNQDMDIPNIDGAMVVNLKGVSSYEEARN